MLLHHSHNPGVFFTGLTSGDPPMFLCLRSVPGLCSLLPEWHSQPNSWNLTPTWSSPEPMTDRIWWINTPTPSLLRWNSPEVCVPCCPQMSPMEWGQVGHYGNLYPNISWIGCLPFPTQLCFLELPAEWTTCLEFSSQDIFSSDSDTLNDHFH